MATTTCTVAAIISFLGAMPPKGTVVTVPRSQIVLAQISALDELKAKACARRYGIQWRIDETR